MPLFGPNIQKMKDKADIEGLSKLLYDSKRSHEAVTALVELGYIERLTKELNSNNPVVRVWIAKAIKEVNDPDATNALCNTLINELEFGEIEEQIVSITLIQGRAPEHFLSFALSNDDKLEHALKEPGKRLNLDTFRDALLGVVQPHRSGAIIWYALIALAELGDRSQEVLSGLIEYSHAYINMLEIEIDGPGVSALIMWILGEEVHEETLRALSCFRGNNKALDAIIKAYEGDFLSSPRISGRQDYAIYALTALGDPSSKERLEYLISHGKAPNEAIELFGKATYDEIKTRASNK
jgi:hypothetical protein